MDCAGSADLLNASIIAHFIFRINLLKSYNCSAVTVCRQEFSDLKILYNTEVIVDLADLEYEVSAESVIVCARQEQ